MFSERSAIDLGSPEPTGEVPRLDLRGAARAAGVPPDAASAILARALGEPPLEDPAWRAPLDLEAARDADLAGAAHVVFHASVAEAYARALALLCDPGDEILVPAPWDPWLARVAARLEVQVVTTPLAIVEGEGWVFDAAALYEAISPRTRAIVAIPPRDPSGRVLRAEELAELAALGLPLLVDLGARALPLAPPRDAASVLAGAEVLVLAMDGLAERAALPQLPLAWSAVVGPSADEAAHRLAALAAGPSCASLPQRALGELLRACAPARDARRLRCATNLAHLRGAIAGTSVLCPPVHGGPRALLRRAARGGASWVDTLRAEGLLVDAGAELDLEPEGAWIGLGLDVEEPVFLDALSLLTRP